MPFFGAGFLAGHRVDVLIPEQGESAEAVMERGFSPPHFPIKPRQLGAGWSFSGLEEGAHVVEGFDVLAREIPHKGGRTFGFRVSRRRLLGGLPVRPQPDLGGPRPGRAGGAARGDSRARHRRRRDDPRRPAHRRPVPRCRLPRPRQPGVLRRGRPGGRRPHPRAVPPRAVAHRRRGRRDPRPPRATGPATTWWSSPPARASSSTSPTSTPISRGEPSMPQCPTCSHAEPGGRQVLPGVRDAVRPRLPLLRPPGAAGGQVLHGVRHARCRCGARRRRRAPPAT